MKPSYRVPLLSEINEITPNGFNAISTFSGCGGSSLGYRIAGFRVLYANEFIDAARETYIANKRDYTFVDGRDIRTVTPSDILEKIGLGVGELDLLDGSPPCASFSTAGKREKAWGKVKKYSDKAQRVDDLFFEFSRLLEGLKPKTFVAENVSGLVKGTAKGYFLEILSTLKKSGYRVEAKLLDAQWLGVPQARQRIIFVGVRDDLGLAPAFPKPLPYRYTLRDALPWIHSVRQVEVYDEGERVTTDSPVPTITQSGIGAKRIEKHYVEAEADISKYCTGREWDKLKPGEQSDKYFNLVRASIDAPSPTICASHGSPGIASVTHPLEKRKFSIAELKRICGFPDDFVLTGSYKQQWERLGRAVPPVMMGHIASAVRDEVLRKC
jgi:DNA (cytosine-5)-methyltransferase 1